MKKVYVWTEPDQKVMGKIPVHWQEEGKAFSTYYPHYPHEVERRIAHLRETYTGWEVILGKPTE